MKRWQANCVIVFVALIWGTTFVAQQTSTQNIGPQYFTGIRFLLGAFVVSPFALREARRLRKNNFIWGKTDIIGLIATGIAMYLGCILQQIGLISTSVTNAAFLTAFYVPAVPLLSVLIFRTRPHWVVWPGGVLCVFGTYLLSGGKVSSLNVGDFWVLSSAVFWALQVIMIGVMVKRTDAPAIVACIQFFITGIIGIFMGLNFEHLEFSNVSAAAFEILYSGIMSAGVAFTLQAVAQNHTPASDAAVIMSAETVFAAISGAVFLGERLSVLGYLGCGVILVAIISVQIIPLMNRRAVPVIPQEDAKHIPL